MPQVEHYIQLGLPKPQKILTPAVVGILVLSVVGFAIGWHAKDFARDNLALSVQAMRGLKVWTIVTYPYVQFQPWNIAWNAILILFMGSAIEREWRTASVVLLWVVTCGVCGIVWLTVSIIRGADLAAWGADPGCFGLIGAFGVLFRGKRFLFWLWTVEAQHVSWFLVAVGIVIGIAQPQTWVFVGGALIGYLYVKLQVRMRSGIGGGGSRFEAKKPSGFVDID
jgi:membrane associated rhomboid family serine protease